MLKALALILSLCATQAHASLQQPKPETDPAPETRKPIASCDPTKPRKLVRMLLVKMVEGKPVPVAVVIVAANC